MAFLEEWTYDGHGNPVEHVGEIFLKNIAHDIYFSYIFAS